MMDAMSAGILIVEDEGIVARDLQQALDEMGYDAFAIAASGEEAVSQATQRWPDVVLMDIRIKGQEDGIQTAALLKKKLPVIVIYLTAHADESILSRAKRTEPAGYLVKPVKNAELRSMIEIALYKRDLDEGRDKLRRVEQRLHTISENVPVAIAYFERDGRVQFANQVFRDLVPCRENPLGMSAMAFLGERLYRESYASRQRALLGEDAHFVVDLERNGRRRTYEVTYLPDHDPGGAVRGVYALGYDVSERERLSADLRQAHVDLQTILNYVPASITSWKLDLTIRFANDMAKSRFGIALNAGSEGHLRELLGAEIYERFLPHIERALAGQPTVYDQSDDDGDGHFRYSQNHFIPQVEDGNVVGLYALAFDVTELRRSHEQVRQLAQRLETVREEERRAVALILHDGLAQDLFAIKLSLDALNTQSKPYAGINALCREIGAAITRCMEDTRTIANELRPVTLSLFGAGPAIAEYARRFGERAGLTVRVEESPDLPRLDEPRQLLLFRAAQEALTNVAQHAGASTVRIDIRAADGDVILEVTDDGVGIDPEKMHKPRSLGLLGLKERLEALGGALIVARASPHGTTLRLRIPQIAADPDPTP